MLKKHLFKTLGLSMLVAVGVMAMSASAAQATWKITVGGSSVTSATLKGTVDPGEMLVPGLLQIDCNSTGSASATIKVNGEVLEGTGSATFKGCVVKDSVGKVNNNCTTNSPGQSAGTIVAKGSGTGTESGTTVFATLKNTNFAEIEINGALCPLDEFDDTVNGTAKLTLLTAQTASVLHKITLDDAGLFYGENEALLHDGVSASNPGTGSAEENSGASWAVDDI